MIQQAEQIQTKRAQIMRVLEAATRPLTGIEVARAAGIPYKPTIDALQALMAFEKVVRVGSKFNARWLAASKLPPDPTSTIANTIDRIARLP